MARDDPEDRFARGMVKLLRYFNLLDTNVGLCLSHLISPGDVQASYAKLANQTSRQRFDELKRIVTNGDEFSTSAVREEFELWFTDATRARSVRNRYVHGNWEYLPLRSEAPVAVCAPPWMADRLDQNAEEIMTLEQFEDMADEVEQIFERFMELRRRSKI